MRNTQPVPLPAPIAIGNCQHQPNGNGRRTNGHGQLLASGQNQTNSQHNTNLEQNGKSSGFNAILDDAQALQNTLREELNRTNQLIGGLKNYRRHAKTMASTLTALRQLEPVEA